MKKFLRKIKTLLLDRGIVGFLRRMDWEDFALRFFPVFLGIVITFAGNAWLTRKREKNEVRETLTLVRAEIKENLVLMKEADRQVAEESRAAQYLMDYYGNYEACHPDSMAKYCNLPLGLYPAKVSSEALELLKNSGLFQKIRDKELSLNIIRAYRSLDILRENYAYYYDKKQKLLDGAMQEQAKAVFATPHFTAADMWGAITSTDEGRQFLHEITISASYGFGYQETAAQLEKVIQQLGAAIGD